jgi:hypothetical protein
MVQFAGKCAQPWWRYLRQIDKEMHPTLVGILVEGFRCWFPTSYIKERENAPDFSEVWARRSYLLTDVQILIYKERIEISSDLECGER